MKLYRLTLAMAAILGLSLMASRADALLLSDDFTVTSPMSGLGQDAAAATAAANNNLANRQSGTHAGSAYTFSGDAANGYNVQTGNTETKLYPGPAVNTEGNYLLMYKAGVQNNLALNYDLAGDNAITISFDMYMWGETTSATSWGAFSLSNSLGTDAASYPTNPSTLYSFQAYLTTITTYNGPGTKYLDGATYTTDYTSSNWTVVLSNVVDGAAGAGSPFGGNGTYVSLYYGDTLIDGRALDAEFGDLTLYLGFFARTGNSGGGIGIDNLSVSAVPEPASVFIVAIGLGFVMLVARRRAVRG